MANFAWTNVDVGGIQVTNGVSLSYISTILNSPISDFTFRRKSKPFRGNYRSANKQFIAHLPIPRPDVSNAVAIASAGARLQQLHTERRRLLRSAEQRLNALGKETKRPDWLFPGLDASARVVQIERLTRLMSRGTRLEAELMNGELRLSIDGRNALQGVFVTEPESQLALSAWRFVCRSISVTDSTKGDDLIKRLRSVPLRSNNAAADQFTDRMRDVATLEATIVAAEEGTNALVYEAFGLTEEERAMVEADRAPIFVSG